VKLTRRKFLKGGSTAILAGLAGLGYGNAIEPHTLSLERHTIKLPRLPSALEGLRIVVLSDFHLQPFTQLPHIQKAIHLADSLRPDLVVFLGDYVDSTVDAIHDLAPALGQINSRFGSFGVLGNHDHWKGARIVTDALTHSGISVLRSKGTSISCGGAKLFLAGIDSIWAGRPDLNTALADHRSNAPVVLLVHEPDYGDIAAEDGRIALQLSGHSHGGQIRVPFLGALQLPSWGKRYDQGLYRVKEMALYTNRGIGVVDIPLRINCPPEVTELTLSGA